mmetsp:Transcript_10029/g.14420  ORF Transcript_10029/g.14420 Transcript_10029/m.14420 type:complete len:83 (+) Transcript_10029:69-317(+)
MKSNEIKSNEMKSSQNKSSQNNSINKTKQNKTTQIEAPMSAENCKLKRPPKNDSSENETYSYSQPLLLLRHFYILPVFFEML